MGMGTEGVLWTAKGEFDVVHYYLVEFQRGG